MKSNNCMQQGVIFHIDVNSAYLAWESLERRRTGELFTVGADGDGVGAGDENSINKRVIPDLREANYLRLVAAMKAASTDALSPTCGILSPSLAGMPLPGGALSCPRASIASPTIYKRGNPCIPRCRSVPRWWLYRRVLACTKNTART